MKHCVTFNIQPKQKIEMIRGINQSLFLFLIQKCLNTKIAKLNATKLKKCGTFYKQCRQKTDMIRVTKVRFKSKVLHCQTKLVKISCSKKLCKVKARIQEGSLLGPSFQSGSTTGAIDCRQRLQALTATISLQQPWSHATTKKNILTLYFQLAFSILTRIFNFELVFSISNLSFYFLTLTINFELQSLISSLCF